MKRLIVFLSLIICLYFAYPFFLQGLGNFLIVDDQLKPADIIVVLSGMGNGERTRQAVELYKKGFAPKLLMSGGPIYLQVTYASLMRQRARYLGVPDQDILLEQESESTMENAIFSLPQILELKAKSVIVVTSPYHTRRAKRTFRKALAGTGIDVLVSSVKDSMYKPEKWWLIHEDTQAVAHEYLSMVFYFFKGY
ncbi:MAG: YdcF family protein [bacterium]